MARKISKPPEQLGRNELDQRLDEIVMVLRSHAARRMIGALKNGKMRFRDLRRAADATDRTISKRLAELVDLQFVDRAVIERRPPEVWYALTPKGRSLIAPLNTLLAWAKRRI